MPATAADFAEHVLRTMLKDHGKAGLDTPEARLAMKMLGPEKLREMGIAPPTKP